MQLLRCFVCLVCANNVFVRLNQPNEIFYGLVYIKLNRKLPWLKIEKHVVGNSLKMFDGLGVGNEMVLSTFSYIL